MVGIVGGIIVGMHDLLLVAGEEGGGEDDLAGAELAAAGAAGAVLAVGFLVVGVGGCVVVVVVIAVVIRGQRGHEVVDQTDRSRFGGECVGWGGGGWADEDVDGEGGVEGETGWSVS